jgi:hypothetical protein
LLVASSTPLQLPFSVGFSRKSPFVIPLANGRFVPNLVKMTFKGEAERTTAFRFSDHDAERPTLGRELPLG